MQPTLAEFIQYARYCTKLHWATQRDEVSFISVSQGLPLIGRWLKVRVWKYEKSSKRECLDEPEIK